MNLREMVAALPAKGLRAKLQQQELRIKQLEQENQWLREQLANLADKGDRHSHKMISRRK